MGRARKCPTTDHPVIKIRLKSEILIQIQAINVNIDTVVMMLVDIHTKSFRLFMI